MQNHLDACPKCQSHLRITRYDCPVCGSRVEGDFTGCTFCRLSDEDRLFALIFIQTEGNMKDVERVLNISYPTIKARLARLNEILAPEMPSVSVSPAVKPPANGISGNNRSAILDMLARGDIDAKTAGSMLRGEIPFEPGVDS